MITEDPTGLPLLDHGLAKVDVPVGSFALFEFKEPPLPRAFLVEGMVVAPDERSAVASTAARPERFSNEAVVLARDEVFVRQWLNGGVAKNAGPEIRGKVEFLDYRPNHQMLSLDAPQAALLVITDAFSPGWRALVDGQPTPVMLVDGAFRGIPVPSGQHQVRLDYRPWFWRVGLCGTLLGLLGGVALLAPTAWLRREKRLTG